jgi:hypothetical protein
VVNLFRSAAGQPGALTAALLALLEHGDKDLLNGLLRRASIPYQVEAGEDLSIQFPAPGGPPGTGLLTTPHFRLGLAAQAPGEPLDPALLGELPATPLVISLTGTAPPGCRGLSWEQVDRWLAQAADQYSPDSRTGFLIGQFRGLLPELGIAYFAGFDQQVLQVAPEALAAVTRFYQTAEQFFERFGPTLGALRQGSAQLRQARPEELLAGYCYRDYSDPNLAAGGFLRCAFSLPEASLQCAVWLAPGTDAPGRLQQRLQDDSAFLQRLQALEGAPALWLWSASGERKIPLDGFQAEDLADIDLVQYSTGLQVGMPFTALPGENLAGQAAERLQSIMEALEPALTTLVH